MGIFVGYVVIVIVCICFWYVICFVFFICGFGRFGGFVVMCIVDCVGVGFDIELMISLIRVFCEVVIVKVIIRVV